MPAWSELVTEVNDLGINIAHAVDQVRAKYLTELHKNTGRNVITYYSGWLQKPEAANAGAPGFMLDDNDIPGFMAVIHGLDRKLGLDLILHTPGGITSSTEALVNYLRSMFGQDIRAIVPHLAMSAGTMTACACKEIVMGKHSSLGPIDPQLGGASAVGVMQEYDLAESQLAQSPHTAPIWQQLFSRYPVAFIPECLRAIEQSREMVHEWLATGMFADEGAGGKAKAAAVADALGDKNRWKVHNRHISLAKAEEIGLKVQPLEADQELQSAILTVHHAYILTLSVTTASKVIENHAGASYIQQIGPQ